MKLNFNLALKLAIMSASLSACFTAAGKDKNPAADLQYGSVAQIRSDYAEGRDFAVKYELRPSPVAVFAIHGGNIEGGTSELARAVAGDDYSYYLFEAYGKKARKFHVTAAKFDDPPALEIAAASRLGLAMHVQKGDSLSICVGGSNEEAAAMMADMLAAEGYAAEYPCKRLPGKSPKNIVNRTELGGVQFEITFPQIKKIVKNRKKLHNFAQKMRKTAENYLKNK